MHKSRAGRVKAGNYQPKPMKYLIEIPDGCKLLLPETHGPIVLSMLGGTVVKERGYPRRMEVAEDGIIVKTVADDVIDPNSELAKAYKQIESLLSTVTQLQDDMIKKDPESAVQEAPL